MAALDTGLELNFLPYARPTAQRRLFDVAVRRHRAFSVELSFDAVISAKLAAPICGLISLLVRLFFHQDEALGRKCRWVCCSHRPGEWTEGRASIDGGDVV